MNATRTRTRYVLRFEPLHAGRGFAFPCDATGRVDMDGLEPKTLANYLFARAVIGHEFLAPSVQRAAQ